MLFVEDLIKDKFKNEVCGSWDLNKKMKRHELIITHTFINTRIASQFDKEAGETKNNGNLKC